MLSYEEIQEILKLLFCISDASFMCKLGDTSTKKEEALLVEVMPLEVLPVEVNPLKVTPWHRNRAI